jgi:glycosyltransferase involved in cell wall biosynthesis
MRLLAIVPGIYDTSPGQRYRIEQWEPLLRKSGVEITYQPFESEELHQLLHKQGRMGRKLSLVVKGLSRRWSLMGSVKDYDVVYVFREAALLGPPFFERWIHHSGVPMVFDFDDAVFVSYRSPSNGYLSYLKFASKTKTICRMASHVMAGNPYLAEYARRVNQRVTLVPTTIDTEKYTVPARKAETDWLTIGWTGSFSTVQHLDTLRSALEKLATRARFRLRVIGTSSYQLHGVDVEAMAWRSATELEDLKAIDIGIMPLPNDAWSKGKCGLKALQFMALGIPTVCSPVGVNTDIIQDEQNGFIAGSEDEWIDKLGRLLQSAELRKVLGGAGRATVEARYSANVQAPRVHELLRSVVRDAREARKVGGKSQTARVQDQGS